MARDRDRARRRRLSPELGLGLLDRACSIRERGSHYPPLHEGGSFGGTRYMPLQFVAHAGLARLTGEYLVSAKLFAYATAIALLLGRWPGGGHGGARRCRSCDVAARRA